MRTPACETWCTCTPPHESQGLGGRRYVEIVLSGRGEVLIDRQVAAGEQLLERERAKLSEKPLDAECYRSADLINEVRRWREESRGWGWRTTPVTDHEIATLAVESWLGVDRLEDIVKLVEHGDTNHCSGVDTED